MKTSFTVLLKEIRRQRNLSAKRHPMYQNNKFGKYFMFVFAGIWVAYLVMFGFLLPTIFREEMPSMEPYHILNRGMWFIFMADFAMRFMGQKLPASEVKPYALLPVKKREVIDCHLLLNGVDMYNLIWLFLLVPFGCMTLWKFFGLGGLIGFLLGYLILIVANGYWNALCRTLMNEHILWVLLPIAVYGGIIALMVTTKLPNTIGMEWGEGFIQWEPLAFLAALAVLALMFWLCRVMQLRIVDKEIARTKTTKLKHVREYKFLDRFGEIGEFLRLEIKLLTRNKVPKVQFRMGLIFMIMFSFFLAFTDMYDNDFMRYFIAIYNFSVLGVMVLSQCMMFEGNYLDGLMSRKESILTLLKAKYYLQCAICVVPLLIMIAPVAKGKLDLLDVFAAFFVTTGFVFFIMFQLAVYNKSTMNLNERVMGRNSTSNWFQTMLIMGGFFLPVILIMTLNAIFPNGRTSVWVTLAIGLAFTIAHPLWLRNVYHRFMKRRYVNMAGFRASRP
ncbi:MAG: hypothetical protein J5814_05005 [Bacteroidaceae bacterium]|nr:hypothetical protein [Bacteroidaceae bacterium]